VLKEEAMKNYFIVTTIFFTLLLAGNSFGQFLCIKTGTANVHSSPSLKGSYVLLQVPRHYPLDVQAEKGDFLQVRDFEGREGWVTKSMVGPETGVVIGTSSANVRSGPGETYEVIFKARKGVTFLVTETRNDWLKVEHESGRKGWVHKSLVWGI
jgi:SH3-like domain-containing protein